MNHKNPTAQEIAQSIGSVCLAMRSRRLTRQITRLFDEALRPHGIKTSQANILVAVAKHGTVVPHVLADVLQLDASTLSRNVSRMRSRGWLAETEGEDARQRPLCLAPAGARLLTDLSPDWERAQKEAESWLGPDGARFMDEASQRARKA